jgi:ABC-type Zn2+ transport system substrate-binding protein/surface adhesin
VQKEINKERKKYNKFLERDKEKIQYINQNMNTKRLVEMSYVNELRRVKERMEKEHKEEEERAEEKKAAEEKEHHKQPTRNRKNTTKSSN